MKLIQSIRNIFASLTFTHRPSVMGDLITNFRKELGRPFNGFNQQDASEFCYRLLDDIITKCDLKPVNNIFSGKMETSVICDVCKKASITHAPFLGIQLPFPTSNNNNDNNNNSAEKGGLKTELRNHYKISGLLDYYFEPDILEDDNAYFCEHCSKKVKKAMKQARFVHMPDILALTVKRFYYDMTGTISGKIRHPLQIEPTLNINNEIFDLYGVVTHHGSSLNSGHYTATASHSDSSDSRWWHFDDSYVKRLDATSIQNIQNAYMLFYKKRKTLLSIISDGKKFENNQNLSSTSSNINNKSSLFYKKLMSPDLLQNIRIDNCKYMIELFTNSRNVCNTNKTTNTNMMIGGGGNNNNDNSDGNNNNNHDNSMDVD